MSGSDHTSWPWSHLIMSFRAGLCPCRIPGSEATSKAEPGGLPCWETTWPLLGGKGRGLGEAMRGGWKRPFWKTARGCGPSFCRLNLGDAGRSWAAVARVRPASARSGWPRLPRRGFWCAAMRAAPYRAGPQPPFGWGHRVRSRVGVIYRLGQVLCWSSNWGSGFWPVMVVRSANRAKVAGAQTVKRAVWTAILVRRAMR